MPGSFTDIGGATSTITTGGVAQTLSAKTTRSGFSIQNLSAGDLWFDCGKTAVLTQPSMKLISGAYYESPPDSAPKGIISIIGATTGQAFAAREY